MRGIIENAIQGFSVVDLFMGKPEGHDLTSKVAPLIYYNILKVSEQKYGIMFSYWRFTLS